MRRLPVVLGVLVVLAGAARAANAPPLLSFEGRLLRADGTPETGLAFLIFRLYTSATAGADAWSEGHPLTLGRDGYYAVHLGGSVGLPAMDGRDYWLGVTFLGEAEMLPRVRLVSVPYALHATNAVNAEKVGGGVLSVAGGNVGIGTTSPDSKLQISGGGTPLHVTGAFPKTDVSTGRNLALFTSNESTGYMALRIEMQGGPTQSGRNINLLTFEDDVAGERGNLNLQTAGGNVGIGTTTPRNRLSVEGAVNGLTTGLHMGPYHLVGVAAGTVMDAFRPDGTADHLALQTSGGNVGIGTLAPQAKLDVEGRAKARTFGRLGASLSGVGPDTTATFHVCGADGGGLIMINGWGCNNECITNIVYSYATASTSMVLTRVSASGAFLNLQDFTLTRIAGGSSGSTTCPDMWYHVIEMRATGASSRQIGHATVLPTWE